MIHPTFTKGHTLNSNLINKINNKITKHNSQITDLNRQLKELKENRIYECSCCTHQMIEKNIILVEEYIHHKSYNSYEDSSYSLYHKFIVCDKCHMWLQCDGIEYPKAIEKLCESQREIPNRCLSFIKQRDEEWLQKRIKDKLEQDIKNAKALLEKNGIKINE